MVMPATEQREIRELGRPSIRPVMDVMTVADPHAAPGESTAAVSVVQRPAQRRRNRPCAGTHFDEPPVLVVPHHDPARVARQAAGRSRGNARALLED
jgi:hypothetical protein